GRAFSNMACVHGELPVRRYEGDAKDVGPQYVRGIVPGNGNPPGKDMWLTYSMNKEDIWISRVPAPIRHKVDKWVNDAFDDMIPGGPVDNWNTYCPKWAPVEAVDQPSVVDKSLKLSDREPYDYARAVRVFPTSKKVTVRFDMLAKQTRHGRMEIDVLNINGARPVRLMLADNGRIQVADGGRTMDVMDYAADKWLSFKINLDASAGKFRVAVDGKEIVRDAAFSENVEAVERLSFRTGEYRKLGIGRNKNDEDLPNAGDPVRQAVYYVNNVSISPSQ
ncbi:MAG: hypothetical protein ACYS76_10405, partial [Planctomycetota bacterium]